MELSVVLRSINMIIVILSLHHITKCSRGAGEPVTEAHEGFWKSNKETKAKNKSKCSPSPPRRQCHSLPPLDPSRPPLLCCWPGHRTCQRKSPFSLRWTDFNWFDFTRKERNSHWEKQTDIISTLKKGSAEPAWPASMKCSTRGWVTFLHWWSRWFMYL